MLMSDTAGEEHVHLSNGSKKSNLHKVSQGFCSAFVSQYSFQEQP